jgi:hypothetical protein
VTLRDSIGTVYSNS